MTDLPAADRLFDALDATWAPLRIRDTDWWRLREGGGGGKRVSAASPRGDLPDMMEVLIPMAEQGLAQMGQPPLFRLTPGDTRLDAALAALGYRVVDPTVIYAAPASLLAEADPRGISAIAMEHPLASLREIWAEGGIGPERMAVMARSGNARTYLLGRADDRPVGAAFVATDRDIAMLHALEVQGRARRKGVGRNLVGASASAALRAGAETLALAVTEANAGARALYESMGMTPVTRYHYRTAA